LPDQLFTKYIGGPLVILPTSYGDRGEDNGCLYRGGYLGIERADAGRGRKGRWGRGRGLRHRVSRVLSP
jgi:hypothetical protein